MNEQAEWIKIFSRASFFSLKKEEDLSSELKIIQSRIQLQDNISSFHVNRKNEYLLGRTCAAVAYQECTGNELFKLDSANDRSPIWPQEIVGSIAHNKKYVGAAVAKKPELLGIGIDFEEIGRAKLELSSHIRSNEDISYHPKFSDEELLTLIFSTKESLYKALYPSVQKFFGFQDAALRQIDTDAGSFQIDLLTQLNSNFGPLGRFSFEGRFMIQNATCLTVIEISSANSYNIELKK